MTSDAVSTALKRMGGAAIIKSLADQDDLEVIPTGLAGFDDDVIGLGGLPRSRVVHLYALTSVGKSTFTQFLAGVTQKQGGAVYWGDAERTIMKSYAQGSGMNIDSVFIPEWSTGPDLLYKTKQAIALGVFDMIVLDSLDAIRPSRDADKLDPSMHDNLAHARLLNGFFYDITGGYMISDADSKSIINTYTVPWYNPKGNWSIGMTFTH